MRNIFILFIVSIWVITSCKKESLVPNLEENKWDQEIPNYITVDSSYIGVKPPLPNYFELYISFSLDEAQIEQDWGKVQGVFAVYKQSQWNYKNTINIPISNGKGSFYFSGAQYNFPTYLFQFYAELENGRTTILSPQHTVSQ
jgi:hypothetical protein